MYAYDVFLSHSSHDKPWVRTLAINLKKYGKKVFLDEWVLKPGDRLLPELDKALKASGAGVLIITPEAINSGWVNGEYEVMFNHGLKNSGFSLIPLLLEGSPDMPFCERYLYADFRNPDEYEKSFYKLLCALDKKEPGPDIILDHALEKPGKRTGKNRTIQASGIPVIKKIFKHVRQKPVILLFQKEVDQEQAIKYIKMHAEQTYHSGHVFHIIPPHSAKAGSQDYFSCIVDCLPFLSTISSPGQFEQDFRHEIKIKGKIFLILTGIEHGNVEHHRDLAGSLRNIYSEHPDSIAIVACGSEKLAELKLRDQDHSLFNIAVDIHWPDFTIPELQAYAKENYSDYELSDDQARELLDMTGKHQGLLRETLSIIEDNPHFLQADGLNTAALINKLTTGFYLGQMISRFRQTMEGKPLPQHIINEETFPVDLLWTEQLVRHMYWYNLLCKKEINGTEELTWRCALIRDACRRILV